MELVEHAGRDAARDAEARRLKVFMGVKSFIVVHKAAKSDGN